MFVNLWGQLRTRRCVYSSDQQNQCLWTERCGKSTLLDCARLVSRPAGSVEFGRLAKEVSEQFRSSLGLVSHQVMLTALLQARESSFFFIHSSGPLTWKQSMLSLNESFRWAKNRR